jgi:hypothetical protein
MIPSPFCGNRMLIQSRGWEGTVLPGLRVESNGRLEKIHIARSSGYAIQSYSALDSLNRFGHLVEAAAAWTCNSLLATS